MRRSAFQQSSLFFREVNQKQNLNRISEDISGMKGKCSKISECAFWLPHPRTGIYYPRGYEWVMDDVPVGASSFSESYWYRNSEGVEKPISKSISESEIFDHPLLDV
ncbi:hypothetical protein LUZ60_005929 [Juncus effusus]|nr:hypothetical protein LUZ60_005929 [Juncus effusus]